MRYNNYHKHTHLSNIFTPDTHIKAIDYMKRCKELGHTNYFTTEHGYGGDIFEAMTLCEEYGLNCIFGIEGYIVKDPLAKDNSNYHIVIIPKTDKARRKLNKINSHANTRGYYYKPRIFIDELLACDKDDFYITTACCGGILKNDDSIENIFMPLYNHFKENVFLEIQNHNADSQKDINRKALELHDKLGLKLIHANDSHYIFPEDAKDRKIFLDGKGINYGEEDLYIIDYPDDEEIIRRYEIQDVVPKELVIEALKNTLVFDDIKNINIDKSIKMPNIYKDLTPDERIQKLKDIINERFKIIKKEDNISKEEMPKYLKSIREEMQVIEDTKSINTMDYFLLNDRVVDKAVNEYGGVLTTTSRGSAGAFYLNRLLNITQLDRNRSKIPLYYERFMSASRLLDNRSMPDCDFNVANPEPFIKASKDLLGEHGCKWMIAYGTMKEGESFRNTCRSKGLSFDEFNEVAKNIDNYREDKKWKPIIELSEKFVGVIVSASAHPCSNALLDGDLEEELGVLKIGDFECVPMTSGEADEWKYLKNDYLTVSTVDITKKVFDLIGIPRMSLVELENALDEKTWDIYKLGLTCTVNQVDGEWATELVRKYKPHTIAETAHFTGVIRPSFEAYRDIFIDRIPYNNKYKVMDDLFESTNHFVIYQENLMQFFEWLGISPAESIGLIKKISKKKIKKEHFDKLVDTLRTNWIKKCGSDEGFDETWENMQSMMGYGYNSPHALAMAYDSLYGAYLKSHYPLEYYTVVLNDYQNDEPRTVRLIEELNYFNIKLLSPKYGYAKGEYFMDKDTNSIYKGITSIKKIGKSAGAELYEASKNQNIKTFYDLMVYFFPPKDNNLTEEAFINKLGKKDENTIIKKLKNNKIHIYILDNYEHIDKIVNLLLEKFLSKEDIDKIIEIKPQEFFEKKTTLNNAMLDILIGLDYFDIFGRSQKLLDFVKYYNLLSGKKSPKKSTIEKEIDDVNVIKIIEDNSNPTAATYSNLNYEKALLDIWDYLPNKDIPITNKIKYQKDYLGNIDYTDSSMDNNIFYVESITRTQKYSRINLYRLKTGKMQEVKIWNSILDKAKISLLEGKIVYLRKHDIKIENQKEPSDEINPKTGKRIWKPIPDKYEFWLLSWQDITYEFEDEE